MARSIPFMLRQLAELITARAIPDGEVIAVHVYEDRPDFKGLVGPMMSVTLPTFQRITVGEIVTRDGAWVYSEINGVRVGAHAPEPAQVCPPPPASAVGGA